MRDTSPLDRHQWHKLYFRELGQELTRIASPEAVGVFFRLMVWQMQDGYLPADKNKLAAIAGVRDDAHFDLIWTQLQAHFEPFTRIWAVLGNGFNEGYWARHENPPPDAIHNPFTTRCMAHQVQRSKNLVAAWGKRRLGDGQ